MPPEELYEWHEYIKMTNEAIKRDRQKREAERKTARPRRRK